MKKKIAVVAVVAVLAMVTVQQASAQRGNSWGQNGCVCQQPAVAQLDQATKDKIAQFAIDTRELKKEQVMKRAELKAVLKGDNPDPATVSKLTGELFDMRTTLLEQAREAGVEDYFRMNAMGGQGRDGKRNGGKNGDRQGNGGRRN